MEHTEVLARNPAWLLEQYLKDTGVVLRCADGFGTYFYLNGRFALVTETIIYTGPQRCARHYGTMTAGIDNLKAAAEFLRDPATLPPTLVNLIDLLLAKVSCDGDITQTVLNNGGLMRITAEQTGRAIVLEAGNNDLAVGHEPGRRPFNMPFADAADWLSDSP